MWINYIGEIAMGLFIFLLAIHFGVHFYFKAQKRKLRQKKKLKKAKEVA